MSTAATSPPTPRSKDEFLESGITEVKSEDLPEDDRACPICLLEYSPTVVDAMTTQREANGQTSDHETIEYNEKPVKILICGHIFGYTCLETHLSTATPFAAKCPICRVTLLDQRTDDARRARLQRVSDNLITIEGRMGSLQGRFEPLQSRLHSHESCYLSAGTGREQDSRSGVDWESRMDEQQTLFEESGRLGDETRAIVVEVGRLKQEKQAIVAQREQLETDVARLRARIDAERQGA